jgi:hypothetical protein
VATLKEGGVPVESEESISKVNALEDPPPGAGVTTVTGEVPAEAICEAVTAAVSLLVLTNVVVSAVVPQLTVELAVKPVPLTVSVKAAPPALVKAGERLLMAGAGLGTATVTAEDTPVALL